MVGGPTLIGFIVFFAVVVLLIVGVELLRSGLRSRNRAGRGRFCTAADCGHLNSCSARFCARCGRALPDGRRDGQKIQAPEE